MTSGFFLSPGIKWQGMAPSACIIFPPAPNLPKAQKVQFVGCQKKTVVSCPSNTACSLSVPWPPEQELDMVLELRPALSPVLLGIRDGDPLGRTTPAVSRAHGVGILGVTPEVMPCLWPLKFQMNKSQTELRAFIPYPAVSFPGQWVEAWRFYDFLLCPIFQ
jgi:hypothetical protein